uniref:Uncharacterized protein n=1 Tax=Arundo donax TaxID=35708 RepID=A0A0A9CLK3_ARUDO
MKVCLTTNKRSIINIGTLKRKKSSILKIAKVQYR